MEDLKNLKKFWNKKKVFITGHTGFKGAWLCIILRYLNSSIYGYALKSEKNSLFNKSKINKEIISNSYSNINNISKLRKKIQQSKPEIIFHLAAQPLVLESYKSPLKTFNTNIIGTLNILECVREVKSVKSVVIITTDKVYKINKRNINYNELDELGGHDPYSASKVAAEIIVKSYVKSFFKNTLLKNRVSTVRAGNVIGGGDWCENRIIPDCIKSIEKNEVIEVRSPNAIRPWQHVLEPIGGYLYLGAKMIEDPISYSQAWNFGPEHENIITVSELVTKLIESYGQGSWKDTSNSKQLHEANLLSLDINKAKTNLHWKPVLGINATIEYTTQWYKNYTSTNVLDLTKRQIKNYVNTWKLQKEK